jgi:hypothetical protein
VPVVVRINSQDPYDKLLLDQLARWASANGASGDDARPTIWWVHLLNHGGPRVTYLMDRMLDREELLRAAIFACDSAELVLLDLDFCYSDEIGAYVHNGLQSAGRLNYIMISSVTPLGEEGQVTTAKLNLSMVGGQHPTGHRSYTYGVAGSWSGTAAGYTVLNALQSCGQEPLSVFLTAVTTGALGQTRTHVFTTPEVLSRHGPQKTNDVLHLGPGLAMPLMVVNGELVTQSSGDKPEQLSASPGKALGGPELRELIIRLGAAVGVDQEVPASLEPPTLAEYSKEDTAMMMYVFGELAFDVRWLATSEFFLPIVHNAAEEGHDGRWVVGEARRILSELSGEG